MKTSKHRLFFALSFMIMGMGMSRSFPSSGDPITIEFQRGRGSDCFGQDRECLAMESINFPSDHSEYAEGVGSVYFNTNDRFVLEITNVFDGSLLAELSLGTFTLDADIIVPGELLIEMGVPPDVVTLSRGVYNVEAMSGNMYRIVF